MKLRSLQAYVSKKEGSKQFDSCIPETHQKWKMYLSLKIMSVYKLKYGSLLKCVSVVSFFSVHFSRVGPSQLALGACQSKRRCLALRLSLSMTELTPLAEERALVGVLCSDSVICCRICSGYHRQDTLEFPTTLDVESR